MIEAHLSFTRGEFRLSGSIKDSGFIVISGPNGSGKTTLLQIISGIIQSGETGISVTGEDMSRLAIDSRRAVYLDSDSYFGHMDVSWHILWPARISGEHMGTIEMNSVREALGIDFTGLTGMLSAGQRARVILATSLAAKARILLVDEIFSSINDHKVVMQNFKNLCSARGIDVLCVTQDSRDEELADHVYKMNSGVLSRKR